MPLLSTCPHCGAKHKFADDSKAGKKIRCRECEEPFTVKAESAGKRPNKAGGKTPAGGLPPRTAGLKTKSKKKAKSEESEKKPARKRKSTAGKSPALIGGICVVVLGLLFGLPLLFPGDEPMQAPESYAEFTHESNSVFKCEYPEGWEKESGGTSSATGGVWAKFVHADHDDVKIRVRSSIGASAVGDIAKNRGSSGLGGSGGANAELEEELAPSAVVHEREKKKFAEDYSDYQEQAPQKIETGFGDTRVSEFTASGSFGSKIRGMRASMLGQNLQFTVICDCPEDDWDVCKPIFERVIKSMSRG